MLDISWQQLTVVTLTYVILNGVKHYRTTDFGTIPILSGKEKKSREKKERK